MRLALTRPREASQRLSDILVGRGLDCIIAPVIEIVDLPVRAALDTRYQAVILTSSNAVRALPAWYSDLSVAVLCVGDATAARASEAGYRDVRSAGGAERDLAELAAQSLDPAAGPLLYLSGDPAAGNLTGLLANSGFVVARHAVYRADPVPALDPAVVHQFARRTVDGVLFYSPRTAGLFAILIERAGLKQSATSMTAYCISPATAASARALNWNTIAVAARPTQPDLLALLATS